MALDSWITDICFSSCPTIFPTAPVPIIFKVAALGELPTTHLSPCPSPATASRLKGSLGPQRDLPKKEGFSGQPLGRCCSLLAETEVSLQVWPGTSQHEKCPQGEFLHSLPIHQPLIEIRRPRFWSLKFLKAWTLLDIRRVPMSPRSHEDRHNFWIYSVKRTRNAV